MPYVIGAVVVISVAVLLVVAWKMGLLTPPAKRGHYEKKESIFTPAERSFLGVLDQAVGDAYRVLGQVSLSEVLKTRPGLSDSERGGAFARISQKHIDFLLCDKAALATVCVIELNDKSHEREAAGEGWV